MARVETVAETVGVLEQTLESVSMSSPSGIFSPGC